MELLLTTVVLLSLAVLFEARTKKSESAEMRAYQDVRRNAQEMAAEAYKLKKRRRPA